MRCCCRYWLTCCCCASMGARSIRSRAQVCLRSSSVLLRRWAKSTWSTWSGSGGENSNRSRPPSLTTITCHFSVHSLRSAGDKQFVCPGDGEEQPERNAYQQDGILFPITATQQHKLDQPFPIHLLSLHRKMCCNDTPYHSVRLLR